MTVQQWGMSERGIFAVIRKGEGAALLREVIGEAGTQALEEWVQGREGAALPLPLRFKPEGMTVLDLTRRSPRYEWTVARQRGGQYSAYRSPRRSLNWGEIAVAIAQLGATLGTGANAGAAIGAMLKSVGRAIDTAAGVHMADRITKRGG